MGGGYYEREVESVPAPSYTSTTSSYAPSAPAYSSKADAIMKAHKTMDASCTPKRVVTCTHRNPVVCALDVTGSMGNWSKIIWDKLPMFFGQLIVQGYLPDPSICFVAVGDANSDQAPLQVTEFAEGTDIDSQLAKLWLEGGGGGQNYETYELAAYYLAKKCEMPNAEQKGIVFFTGDEGYYPAVLAEHRAEIFGDDGPTIPAAEIWKELRRKFHVFFLHKPYFDEEVDEEMVEKWNKAVGPEHVLHMDDPKAVVDVMLGAIALAYKSRTMDKYFSDMQERGQTPDRIKKVKAALGSFSTAAVDEPTPTLSTTTSAAVTNVGEDKLRTLNSGLEYLRTVVLHFPANLRCPVTGEVFKNPVRVDCGSVYEKEAIESWLEANTTDPLTGKALASKAVVQDIPTIQAMLKFYNDNCAQLGATPMSL